MSISGILFLKKSYKGSIKIICFALLMLMFSAGCATRHKYKRYKPLPCPCEARIMYDNISTEI